MESLLSGTRLTDELEFFKKQLSLVATQHVKYPNGYVPPLEHRPKKATLAEVRAAPTHSADGQIPVCQPPAARNDEGAPAVGASLPSPDSADAPQSPSRSRSSPRSPRSSSPSRARPPRRLAHSNRFWPLSRAVHRRRTSAGCSRGRPWATPSSCASLLSRKGPS